MTVRDKVCLVYLKYIHKFGFVSVCVYLIWILCRHVCILTMSLCAYVCVCVGAHEIHINIISNFILLPHSASEISFIYMSIYISLPAKCCYGQMCRRIVVNWCCCRYCYQLECCWYCLFCSAVWACCVVFGC